MVIQPRAAGDGAEQKLIDVSGLAGAGGKHTAGVEAAQVIPKGLQFFLAPAWQWKNLAVI